LAQTACGVGGERCSAVVGGAVRRISIAVSPSGKKKARFPAVPATASGAMADDGAARYAPAFGAHADAAIAQRRRADAVAAEAIRTNLGAQLRAIGTRRDDTYPRAPVRWIRPNLFAELCVREMIADAEATVRNQLRLLWCDGGDNNDDDDDDDDDEYNNRR
jgi:hypothetical protein